MMGDIDTEGRQCLYASLETFKDERALLYWEEHIVSPKGGRSPEPAVGADGGVGYGHGVFKWTHAYASDSRIWIMNRKLRIVGIGIIFGPMSLF